MNYDERQAKKPYNNLQIGNHKIMRENNVVLKRKKYAFLGAIGITAVMLVAGLKLMKINKEQARQLKQE